VRWEALPWRTAGGEIGGIMITAENVTAKTQAENRLREREKVMRALGSSSVTPDERRRHVDADPFDVLGRAAVGGQLGNDAANRIDLAAFADRQYTVPCYVCGQRLTQSFSIDSSRATSTGLLR
jgi:hypothetical protein